MNVKAFDAYRSRFLQLLEYIDSNLEENLTVDKLSIIAAFSKYHFHRQFSEFLGIGVYKYVQLNRLKRASYQLAFRDRPIVDIALKSGYESPEAFARAFKKSIAQTPSEFRKQPQWENWHATYQQLSELRNQHMKSDTSAEQVKIVIFPQTKVAALEHRGDPQLIGNSVRKFIEWRQQNNLPPKVSKTFNIVYDNPAETPPEDYRLDICAATDRNIINNSFGVMGKIIPGGRCAVLRYTGSNDNLGEAVRYLYSEWLPQSGEQLRDFPLYFERVSLFPDVPESEAITDVFLPLE